MSRATKTKPAAMSSTAVKAPQDTPKGAPEPAVPMTATDTGNVVELNALAKTNLDGAACLTYFGKAGAKAGEASILTICAGILYFLVKRHFVPAVKAGEGKGRPQTDSIIAKMYAELRATDETSGNSTLRAFVTAASRGYTKLTSSPGTKDHMIYGGVVSEIRTAKSPEKAADIILDYISGQKLDDGQPVTKSHLGRFKTWCETADSHAPAAKKQGLEAANAIAKRQGAAIDEAMKEDKTITAQDVAKATVQNLPSSIPPQVVAAAAIDKLASVAEHKDASQETIASAIRSCEATLIQTIQVVARINPKSARKIIAELTEYVDRVERDAVASAKASPTATATNKAAALAANASKDATTLKAEAARAKRAQKLVEKEGAAA